MLFFHLFDRTDSSAKICELGKFLLYLLQSLVPLAVSNLRRCVVPTFPSILFVQLLKLRDLNAETSDLFPKDFEVIHVVKNSSRWNIGRECSLLGRLLWLCRLSQGTPTKNSADCVAPVDSSGVARSAMVGQRTSSALSAIRTFRTLLFALRRGRGADQCVRPYTRSRLRPCQEDWQA